jgi:hypothetical protein
MRAVAVFPERRAIELVDHPAPEPIGPSEVLAKVLEVGVCGTDREIARFEYGTPPPSEDNLVIGHESLAEVVEVGDDVNGLTPGDLVVTMVRRGCGHPVCRPCRAGRQDFCTTGDYTERGIKGRHGFMTDQLVDDARFMVRLPDELRAVGVLTEPLTIAQKALDELWRAQDRLPWIDAGAAPDAADAGTARWSSEPARWVSSERWRFARPASRRRSTRARRDVGSVEQIPPDAFEDLLRERSVLGRADRLPNRELELLHGIVDPPDGGVGLVHQRAEPGKLDATLDLRDLSAQLTSADLGQETSRCMKAGHGSVPPQRVARTDRRAKAGVSVRPSRRRTDRRRHEPRTWRGRHFALGLRLLCWRRGTSRLMRDRGPSELLVAYGCR